MLNLIYRFYRWFIKLKDRDKISIVMPLVIALLGCNSLVATFEYKNFESSVTNQEGILTYNSIQQVKGVVQYGNGVKELRESYNERSANASDDRHGEREIDKLGGIPIGPAYEQMLVAQRDMNIENTLYQKMKTRG